MPQKAAIITNMKVIIFMTAILELAPSLAHAEKSIAFEDVPSHASEEPQHNRPTASESELSPQLKREARRVLRELKGVTIAQVSSYPGSFLNGQFRPGGMMKQYVSAESDPRFQEANEKIRSLLKEDDPVKLSAAVKEAQLMMEAQKFMNERAFDIECLANKISNAARVGAQEGATDKSERLERSEKLLAQMPENVRRLVNKEIYSKAMAQLGKDGSTGPAVKEAKNLLQNAIDKNIGLKEAIPSVSAVAMNAPPPLGVPPVTEKKPSLPQGPTQAPPPATTDARELPERPNLDFRVGEYVRQGAGYYLAPDGKEFKLTSSMLDGTNGGVFRRYSNDGGKTGIAIDGRGRVYRFNGNSLGFVGENGTSAIGRIQNDGSKDFNEFKPYEESSRRR